MAAKKAAESAVKVNIGSPNSEPQWKFFLSTAKYTCYGGARGGGKSWAVVRKAALGSYTYPGIRILILRREYGDMEGTLIDPMLKRAILTTLCRHSHKQNKQTGAKSRS